MNKLPVVLTLVIFATACASSPAATDAPTVTIAQTSVVHPIRAQSATVVPVTYRLDVTNAFDNDVTLTALQIETIGSSGSYTMKAVKHRFSEVIPAHGSKSIDIRAWVLPVQINEGGSLNTPVVVRGIAQFASKGTTLRRGFTETLEQ
jgi:hypothetical protein